MNWSKLKSKYGALLLASLSALAYFIQSIRFAHGQISVLDEGAYLVKGLLFARGRFMPFEDFGPLTNHMPLSFLIPGLIQDWFGPGLRSGRYFSIFLGLLMLLGVWLLVRRLRGDWWAGIAVTFFALNSTLIRMYSVGVSQVLVATLLTWSLFFLLGEERGRRKLMIASALAGILLLTRINMAPVLLFALLYIAWQYGGRQASWAAFSGLGVVMLGHLLFWPSILTLWAFWLPESITPFLEEWRISPDSVGRWSLDVAAAGRLNSFLQALRINLLPVMGILLIPLMWSREKLKERVFEFRMLVFVSALFVFLFAIHAVASLGGDYCVYCFQVYLGFFDVLGVLALILAFTFWREEDNRTHRRTSAAVALFLFGLVGYAAADIFPREWILPSHARALLDFNGLRGIKLWVLIQNKWGGDYQQIVNMTGRFLRQWLPVAIALFTGLGILFIAYLYRERRPGFLSNNFPHSFSSYLLLILLTLVLLLTPTQVLSGSYTSYDCDGDVIAGYEAVGESLAAHIEEGALVYWAGGNSAVPLLYITHAEIFPPQLNNGYSFRTGGDPKELFRFGYWNDELHTEWIYSADYLLIEDRYYTEFYIDSGDWAHVAVSPPADDCREGASIHILKRVPPS